MTITDLGVLLVTVVTCAVALLADRDPAGAAPTPVVRFCRRCRDRSVPRRSDLCPSCAAEQADSARYGLDVWW